MSLSHPLKLKVGVPLVICPTGYFSDLELRIQVNFQYTPAGMHMIKSLYKGLVFLILYFPMPVLAQSLTIRAENNWAGIFAGRVTPYKIVLSSDQKSHSSITWKLISKGRVLSSGQQTVNFSNKESGTITLPLSSPPVKPGITLASRLIIEKADENDLQQRLVYDSNLTIYGPDIPLTEKKVYRKLDIQLFDPIGRTSEILDELSIPYSVLSKSQLINQTNTGLILIGAGIEFNSQRGLANALIDLAKKGQRILVLQPLSGQIRLATLSNSAIKPSTMSFADDSIVTSFAEGFKWINNDPMKTHGIRLDNRRQTILANIVSYQEASWDWFRLEFNQTDGQLIVCMLPFLDYIKENPVPKAIFSRLLIQVNGLSPDTQNSP